MVCVLHGTQRTLAYSVNLRSYLIAIQVLHLIDLIAFSFMPLLTKDNIPTNFTAKLKLHLLAELALAQKTGMECFSSNFLLG